MSGEIGGRMLADECTCCFVDIVQTLTEISKDGVCRRLRENKIAVNGCQGCKGKNEIQVQRKREGSNQRMWNCGPMMLLASIQLVLVLVLVRSDIGM